MTGKDEKTRIYYAKTIQEIIDLKFKHFCCLDFKEKCDILEVFKMKECPFCHKEIQLIRIKPDKFDELFKKKKTEKKNSKTLTLDSLELFDDAKNKAKTKA